MISRKIFRSAGANPFRYNIFICLAIVLFPLSPAPNRSSLISCWNAFMSLRIWDSICLFWALRTGSALSSLRPQFPIFFFQEKLSITLQERKRKRIPLYLFVTKPNNVETRQTRQTSCGSVCKSVSANRDPNFDFGCHRAQMVADDRLDNNSQWQPTFLFFSFPFFFILNPV